MGWIVLCTPCCQVQPYERLACARNAGDEADRLVASLSRLVNDLLDPLACRPEVRRPCIVARDGFYRVMGVKGPRCLDNGWRGRIWSRGPKVRIHRPPGDRREHVAHHLPELLGRHRDGTEQPVRILVQGRR